MRLCYTAVAGGVEVMSRDGYLATGARFGNRLGDGKLIDMMLAANPNGSGISLGHPVGATGVIIAEKAISELERGGGRYAVVTMCIDGGQSIAALFERRGLGRRLVGED